MLKKIENIYFKLHFLIKSADLVNIRDSYMGKKKNFF